MFAIIFWNDQLFFSFVIEQLRKDSFIKKFSKNSSMYIMKCILIYQNSFFKSHKFWVLLKYFTQIFCKLLQIFRPVIHILNEILFLFCCCKFTSSIKFIFSCLFLKNSHFLRIVHLKFNFQQFIGSRTNSETKKNQLHWDMPLAPLCDVPWNNDNLLHDIKKIEDVSLNFCKINYFETV